MILGHSPESETLTREGHLLRATKESLVKLANILTGHGDGGGSVNGCAGQRVAGEGADHR